MKKSYIFSSLSDAFLIFVGMTGVIFASISSYALQINQSYLIIIIALTSLSASFALHLQKTKRLIAVIAYIVLSILALLSNKDLIVGGFLRFANKMLFLFQKFNDDIGLIDTYSYVGFHDIDVYTSFFAVVACIGALLAAIALIRLRSVTTCLLFTLPIIAPALIFVNQIPNISFVALYLGFIFGAALTNTIRSGKKNTASGVVLAIPALTMLILISVISPPSQYERSDVGQKIYNYLAERLPLTAGEQGIIKNNDPSVVSNYIDLNNSVAPRSLSAVMSIRSGMRGTFLLRGTSYDNFNGTSWKITVSDSSSYASRTYNNDLLGKNLIINPFTSATFGLDTTGIQKKTVEISHVYSGASIVYMPYLSIINEDNPFTFKNDSYFSIDPGNDLRPYYSFEVLNYFNISPTDMLESYSPQNVDTSSVFTSQYNSDNWVYDTYLQIDSETRNFLLNVSSEAGITPNEGDSTQLIYDIADYIKNCAEYDLNTPKTPQDENFVIYFMRESKNGFCMHFASAATMMYRAWGIPARYVTGYSKYISGSKVNHWSIVRQKYAHAWVEIYIDGLGWIPIDVTPPISGVTAPDDVQNESSAPTVSEPAESKSDTKSEPEASSEQSTTQNVSQSNSPTEADNSWIQWALIALLALIIISIPIIRRLYKLRKREKAFEGPTNKAAIAAWQYIERLIPYGANPNPKAYDIALKATFSNHALTKEEANEVIQAALTEAKRVYQSMDFFRKFILCYIKGLY